MDWGAFAGAGVGSCAVVIVGGRSAVIPTSNPRSFVMTSSLESNLDKLGKKKIEMLQMVECSASLLQCGEDLERCLRRGLDKSPSLFF